MENLSKEFYRLSRTQKTEFIDQRIDYASDRALVRHIGAYIQDILEDIWESGEFAAAEVWLEKHGYRKTEKK